MGQYIGATAQKTEKMIKKAEGGVLFVDEAYRLCPNSEKDFGREAIETIMARMTPSDGEQTIFIFAGYRKEMEEFVQINAGLMRRIKTRLYFENFTAEALSHITKIKMMKGHKVPHNIDVLLIDCFKSIPADIISQHNAALCEDLVDCIQTSQEQRLSLDCSSLELQKFSTEDIQNGILTFRQNYHNTSKMRDVGTMTDLGMSDIISPPAVTLNIPNESPRFSSPV